MGSKQQITCHRSRYSLQIEGIGNESPVLGIDITQIVYTVCGNIMLVAARFRRLKNGYRVPLYHGRVIIRAGQ